MRMFERIKVRSLAGLALIVLSNAISANGSNALKEDRKGKLSSGLAKHWIGSSYAPYKDARGYVVQDPFKEQPVVVTKRGFFSVVELPPNVLLLKGQSVLIAERALFADPAIVVGNRADKDGKDYFFTTITLVPTQIDGSTALLLQTNVGVFNIRLVIAGDNDPYMPLTRFEYAEGAFTPPSYDSAVNFIIQKHGDKFNVAEKKADSPAQNKSCNGIDKKYEVTDSDYLWRPIEVCDNGKHTFITLSRNAEIIKLPSIVGVVNDDIEFINYSYEADSRIFKIEGIHEKILVSLDGDQVFIVNSRY